ncbi:four helix bundle protein [Pedobacter sp. UC225_65]|uniref:four helix bundle protein n=1 Tax=Pedobacter sp. UC225_65 TaxID=3350173 RepID=UPI003671500D
MYNDFTEMSVWKLAMDYAVQIFNLTNNLPKREDYALTSQIRRSSVSISDNLAEGFGRETKLDKKRFYIISRGSLLESKSQLLYGKNVGYFDKNKVEELIKINEKIHFELNKLIKSLSLVHQVRQFSLILNLNLSLNPFITCQT